MSMSASLISNIKEQLIIIEHTQLIKSFPSSGRTQYPIISTRQTNDIFLLFTVLSSLLTFNVEGDDGGHVGRGGDLTRIISMVSTHHVLT